MKIESAAGEFDFDIEKLTIQDNELVLIGKMGVWEAETSLSKDDALKLFGMMISSLSFWSYATKLPFYALKNRNKKIAEES